MELSLQNFQQLLQRMAAAVQRSGSQLIDLSVGSILRAVLEANASVALWIQWLIVQTLRTTRAATSKGVDLDTWMADFSLARQPAVTARGSVTFSRLMTNMTTIIPVGTQVRTTGIPIRFLVDADPSNTAWLSDSRAYALRPGVAAIDVPVVADIPGSNGNVVANSIVTIATAVPGLDFVSNSYALSGGTEAEDDEHFRSRFQDYINSRSRATKDAVDFAIASLQQTTRHRLFENIDAAGAWQPGHFLLVVDDGTGQPTAALLAAAHAAVDAVRPIGSNFTIIPPDTVTVTVVIGLSTTGRVLEPTDTANIIAAVSFYINHIPIGGTLYMTRVVESVYKAVPIQRSIASVLINGTAADLVAAPRSILRAASVTVQ